MRCVHSNDSIVHLRQADATAHVRDIRSNGGTDGHRSSRGVDSLSDLCLVGLSAMVPAGTGIVGMLVSVSAAGYVAQNAMARQCRDTRRQHRGGRKCNADAARQRLPVCLFSADGLYDSVAHADHDELPAQPAKAGGAA